MANKFEYDYIDAYREIWDLHAPYTLKCKKFLLENVIPQLEEEGHVSESLDFEGKQTKHHNLFVLKRGETMSVIQDGVTYKSVFMFLPVKPGKNGDWDFLWSESKLKDRETPWVMFWFEASVEYSDDEYVEELDRFILAGIDHVKNNFNHNLIHQMLWNSVTVPREEFVTVKSVYEETNYQFPVNTTFFAFCFDVSVMCHYFKAEGMDKNYEFLHGDKEW